jgi:hypothetical protein
MTFTSLSFVCIVFSLSPYNLIGLCGAHRWGDNTYILANIYCIVKYGSRGMSPAIQSNQDVHVCGSRYMG